MTREYGPLILQKCACQGRAIWLKYRHNLFEGGSYRRRGEADHEQRVSTLSLVLLPSYFLTKDWARLFAFFPLQL
jgi:hypothetical protein